MSDKNRKQLSRREALKLLGAAVGAATLANLPNKWSTPQISAGVLPAHAQSTCTRIFSASYASTVNNTSEVKQYVAPTYESEPVFPVSGTFTPPEIYQVSWECTSGCLEVDFRGPWDLAFPDGSSQSGLINPYIYVNLGTGQYWLNTYPGSSAGGCDWIGPG